MNKETILKIKWEKQIGMGIIICILFSLFFFISLGLGYPVLNRYSPTELNALSDSAFYANIVKDGISAISSDLRTTRVILPLFGHFVYTLMPEQLGSWNIVSLSLLIVNAVFCSMSGVLIFVLGVKIWADAITAIIASLLFFLNFSISNFYLTGLIDSGFSFSFLMLAYLLVVNKWSFLPLLAGFGTLIKEAFLPIGSTFLLGWFLTDIYITKNIDYKKLAIMILFVLTSSAIVVGLKTISSGELKFPWQYMPGMASHAHYLGVSLFYTIIRFFYVFIWLLPLALFSIQYIPARLLSALLISSLVVLALEWWVGASGAGFGRTLFDLAGGIFSLAAANTLINLVKSYHSKLGMINANVK